MHAEPPGRYTDLDDCVEALLSRVGWRVVLGLPVGIGKPNPLVNTLVQRAIAEPRIRLTIVTALSLRAPRWRSDLERRYLEPLVERLFGDYPELEYVRLLEGQRLPDNIEVTEFYLEPGAWLGNDTMQRHYLSANYTHVLRDALARGLNVLAQAVAPPPAGEAEAGMLSLASNADLTVDLLARREGLRAEGRPVRWWARCTPSCPSCTAMRSCRPLPSISSSTIPRGATRSTRRPTCPYRSPSTRSR